MSVEQTAYRPANTIFGGSTRPPFREASAAVVTVVKCAVCKLFSVVFWSGKKKPFQMTIFSVVQLTTGLEAKRYHIPYQNEDFQKKNDVQVVLGPKVNFRGFFLVPAYHY